MRQGIPTHRSRVHLRFRTRTDGAFTPADCWGTGRPDHHPCLPPRLPRIREPSFLALGASPLAPPMDNQGPAIPILTRSRPLPAAACVGSVPRSSLPTTLGSFCLRSGIRGSFMLIRLKRPHRRCGAFFLPSESSLRGRGLSEGAGPGKAHLAGDPARRAPGYGPAAKPHPRAGSLPRQAQQQPSSESSRPRSRASSAPAPITPLR